MSRSSGSPGLILFLMPSITAISITAKAKYGLLDGSGQRNSMRFALGFDEYIGMRIAAAIRQVHRGLEAGDEPLVAIGRRIGEGADRRGVLDQAADRVQAKVREPRIPRAREQVDAALPERTVNVHAGA